MPSGLIQKLRGDFYLAYRATLAHPLRQLFSTDERSGRQRFLDNYAPEGLVPTTMEDREVLRGASRCIHCGLCEAYDSALAQLPRTVYDGASALAVSYSRATPELPHARAAVLALAEDTLRRGEAVCPTRVPLRALLSYLQRKLAELDRVTRRGDAP
jgi:succinate dehydrogenase/fumarate reductase-like Fe-S protein